MAKADRQHVQPTVNLLWAFASLRIMPPLTLLPLPIHSNNNSQAAENTKQELLAIIQGMHTKLLTNKTSIYF